MTEEDCALITTLTDACDTFCVNLARNQLTQDDHVQMTLLFLELADRMLKRLIDAPATAEDTDA